MLSKAESASAVTDFVFTTPKRETFVSTAPRWLTRQRLALGVCFVLWVFCNPYFEIDRSSLIYSARVLADFDPAGVGRDQMFVHDGQSSFTLFTFLYRAITSATGPAAATLIVAATSVAASFAGAFVLSGAICGDRARLLAIVFAAALPACYGGFKLFSYAETAATPRPFTEALVLVGMAALVRDRRLLAAAAMICAAILHPIMALSGLLVLIVWLSVGNWRWLVPVGLLAAALLVAALMHVPLVDRLTAVIDPAWKAVLIDRNPHLFPSRWPAGWIGRSSARVATLLIASSLTTGPVRKLLLITIAVGLGGLGVAYLFDERLPIVLLVQAQTWRAMWLVFSLATLAAAICTVELWPRGGSARVVLMLLALSWIYADFDQDALFAVAALLFHFCLDPRHYEFPKKVTATIVAGAGVLLVVGLAHNEFAIARMFQSVPSPFAGDAFDTLAIDWDDTPLAVIAAIGVLVWRAPKDRTALVATALIGAVLATALWDRRSAENRYLDSGTGVSDLQRLVSTRQGEIFWLDGSRESWSWLARPQWISPIQGAGLVFSRPLAMIYGERARRAIDAGLADGTILAPFTDLENDQLSAIDPRKVDAFCAFPDAPAWIVVPVTGSRGLPPSLHATRWTAPVTKLQPTAISDGSVAWDAVASYDVLGCAH